MPPFSLLCGIYIVTSVFNNNKIRNMKKLFILLVVASSLISCQKEAQLKTESTTGQLASNKKVHVNEVIPEDVITWTGLSCSTADMLYFVCTTHINLTVAEDGSYDYIINVKGVDKDNHEAFKATYKMKWKNGQSVASFDSKEKVSGNSGGYVYWHLKGSSDINTGLPVYTINDFKYTCQ
jgi:hypothetical protein